MDDTVVENLETLTLDNNNLSETKKIEEKSPELVASNVKGTLKFYAEDKQFGYITREDRKGDIYVSEKEISTIPVKVPGLFVQFNIMRGDGGNYAVDLCVI